MYNHRILIPKGEKITTNPSNYRLISLLENIQKILERIIIERLQRHLDNELLNEKQFGFRKRRGCQKAIALVSMSNVSKQENYQHSPIDV